jgi:cholesterol oxidase
MDAEECVFIIKSTRLKRAEIRRRHYVVLRCHPGPFLRGRRLNPQAIVIGSGFGGAVVACRLAQQGYRVTVLERGRQWDAKSLPRQPADAWIWDEKCPEKLNGWFDVRFFPRMAVVQGAGVGGGSLVYANVSVTPRPETFAHWDGFPDWPVTFQELKDHFETVGRVMGVRQLPDSQWTPRTRLMQEAATKLNVPGKFQPLELAINFDDDMQLDVSRPPGREVSRTTLNSHGAEQGSCYHCGNCDIGCDVDARNTLEKNYLHLARQNQAVIEPLCRVTHVEANRDGGYTVHFERLRKDGRVRDSLTSSIVVLAAGSLGSTELLLRSRDEYRTLPNASSRLGRNWSSNGDFLTPAFYSEKHFPSIGPTITSAIDFHDRLGTGKPSYWIQDGGFPDLLNNLIGRLEDRKWRDLQSWGLLTALKMLTSAQPSKHVMPWFAQGIDGGDGVLSLRRPWHFFGKHELGLSWNPARSEAVIDEILQRHIELSHVTNGDPLPPTAWTAFRSLITPHPLGGCAMADSIQTGVVDRFGQVFNYPGLYVADGALFPRALGVNPSRTIAALAEHIAAAILRK